MAIKSVMVRLEPELWEAFRLRTIRRRETMQEVLERAVRAYVEETDQEEAAGDLKLAAASGR